MNRLLFNAGASPDIALLVKDVAILRRSAKSELGMQYFAPIASALGEKLNNRVIAIGTYHPATGKVKKQDIKVFSEEILDYCDTMGIDKLIVADSDYFKYLTGTKAVEKHVGEVLDCAVPQYEHIQIVPILNSAAVDMFPAKKPLQDKAFIAAASMISGEVEKREEFKFTEYKVLEELSELSALHKHKELTIDIEATGLKPETAELISISFSWSDTSAFVVPIHRRFIGEDAERDTKAALKEFFLRYSGKKIYHNALFDVKFLVWHLFMGSPTDYVGRTNGTNVLDGDDTMIMAYLCLNSTIRPSLSLKDLSYEYIGEYAVDVKNIMEALDNGALTEAELYEYNGKDTAATFYLYEKYKAKLVEEEQLGVYTEIMQPALNYLVQMMLNGLPLDRDRVVEVEAEIKQKYERALSKLRSNSYVKLAVRQLRMEAADKYNATHKVMRKSQGDFMDLTFNPNSSKQLSLLLFNIMDYTPEEFTPKGSPKSSRAIIEELLEGETEYEKREVLEALITISQTAIILSTFLESFKEFWYNVDDTSIGRLYGNQRLGGTISGRLSSNSPWETSGI